MLVEFIGSTGSGKTTLIQAVQASLSNTTQVTTASEFVTGMLGMQRVKNATAQNLIQEMIGLPYFVRSFPRYQHFLAYTTRMILSGSGLSFASVNNLRSLERKIAVYEITRRYTQDWVILVDEGPVLAAHMFAFNGTPLAAREIARFASLLPLPDLLVYVKAPVETLVQRTLKRPDAPRELRSRGQKHTEQAVCASISLFDQLVRAENIRSRLLIVENSDRFRQAAAIECITGFIRKYQV